MEYLTIDKDGLVTAIRHSEDEETDEDAGSHKPTKSGTIDTRGT